MGLELLAHIYIEITPKSEDKKFLDEWFSKIESIDGISNIEKNIVYDSTNPNERSIITFDKYGYRNLNYDVLDDFKEYFTKYDNLLISANEWMSTDEGYLYEKIDGEKQ